MLEGIVFRTAQSPRGMVCRLLQIYRPSETWSFCRKIKAQACWHAKRAFLNKRATAHFAADFMLML